jgi:hypothetical protein
MPLRAIMQRFRPPFPEETAAEVRWGQSQRWSRPPFPEEMAAEVKSGQSQQ